MNAPFTDAEAVARIQAEAFNKGTADFDALQARRLKRRAAKVGYYRNAMGFQQLIEWAGKRRRSRQTHPHKRGNP